MSTTTTTEGRPRTAAALAARQRGTDAALQRVRDALAHLRKERLPVSTAAVARRAGVSRTFLYENPQARAAIASAVADAGQRRRQAQTGEDTEREASWRERALNAEDALKAAHNEIGRQRTRIGELLGQIRDLETAWTDETIGRITTENTTLKQRVRQLTTDNRTLDERLTAARSNLRFQDRRLADVEAQLAERDAPPAAREPHPAHRPGRPQTATVEVEV